MRLNEYITEYVSSGRRKHRNGYTPFPKDRTDKDAIIRWLVENGFQEIKDPYYSADDLVRHHTKTGEKCFYVASHDKNNYLTYWIRFYDGNKIFCIRTCPLSVIPRGSNDCTVIEEPRRQASVSKRLSLDDVIEYFKNSEYITEYVSSGRSALSYTGEYTPFPKDREDAKAIQNWLEENGFTMVKGPIDTSLNEHFFATGEKCYQKGPYGRDKATHWFRFFDGEMMFFIRTCDDSFIQKHRSLFLIRKREIKKGIGTMPEDTTMDEIIRYFKEKR
jgi:hypothetical protein